MFVRCSASISPWNTKKVWAEISRSALENNLRVIQQFTITTGARLGAVVKADAYGHGAALVVPVVEKAGVSFFIVATIDEGIAVRDAGARGEVLILGTTDARFTAQLKEYRLTQTLVSKEDIVAFSRESEKTGGESLRVHLKLDTGMTRLGFSAEPGKRRATAESMVEAARSGALEVCGVYSHFASTGDRAYSEWQRRNFSGTTALAEDLGFPRVLRHMGSSGAIPGQPENHFDLVRPGIVLYGGAAGPSPDVWSALRPVMTVKCRVEQVRDIAAGKKVGYDGTWAAPGPARLAVVNMGYADGLPRLLSNKGVFYYQGKACPIRGNVCMDRCMVEITGMDDVRAGSEMLFFGQDRDVRVDARVPAQQCGTIDYELFCGITERVPRILVE